MNYKYKIEDKEIVVSEDEHKIISKDMQAGKSIIFLRAGKLALNSNFIRWIKDTDEMTEQQEEQRLDHLRLSPEKRTAPALPRLSATTQGLEPALLSNGKICASCKEVHYIPDDKTMCLVCIKKLEIII